MSVAQFVCKAGCILPSLPAYFFMNTPPRSPQQWRLACAMASRAHRWHGILFALRAKFSVGPGRIASRSSERRAMHQLLSGRCRFRFALQNSSILSRRREVWTWVIAGWGGGGAGFDPLP